MGDQDIPVGSPAFFAALLAHIEDATFGQRVPIDHVILQSILLCLISGNKHLLLRTAEEDVPLVLKVATTMLTTLFGLSTHKLRIRKADLRSSMAKANTDAFIRSVLFPGASNASIPDTPTSKAEKRHSASRKRRSRRMERSMTSPPGSDPFASMDSTNPFGSSQGQPPLPHHPYTEPIPMHERGSSLISWVIPNAVVVSGLEHASQPSQRALTRVLIDGRVIFEAQAEEDFDGVWNLPEKFFMVYVCPTNAQERPGIHKTLLDQFAMSATIILSSNNRALARRPSSHTHLDGPVIPSTYLPCLHRHYKRTHFPSRLSLYLDDIFSAIRQHHEIDGTLLTARAVSDATDLARAARVLGTDRTGMELIQEAALYEDEHGGSTLSQGSFLSSEYEGTENSHLLRAGDDEKYLGIISPQDGMQNQIIVNLPAIPPKQPQDALPHSEVRVLDVSEADIARIAPRVVSHRLRVRDADDSMFRSALMGATMPQKKGQYATTTVKDVVVQVLADV